MGNVVHSSLIKGSGMGCIDSLYHGKCSLNSGKCSLVIFQTLARLLSRMDNLKVQVQKAYTHEQFCTVIIQFK